jgi:hypothetical protein
MAHLVVAYPKIGQEDFDWIQEYRKQNDPRYFSVIKPHFTVVFPVEEMEQNIFLAEIKKKMVDINKFDFELKVATINQDDSGKYYHEFLVPDKGCSDIVKLHDKLYSEVLSKHLRLDIDFIPHIGIGNSDDAKISKTRIDRLNQQGVYIAGVIDVLDVIEYKDNIVTTLESIPLN